MMMTNGLEKYLRVNDCAALLKQKFEGYFDNIFPSCSAVDIQDMTFVTAAAAGIGSYAAAVTANKKREKTSAAASSSSSAAGHSSSVETSTIQVTKKKSRGPAVAESLARGRGGGKGIVGDTRNG